MDRAAIYVRVSTDLQGESGHSLDMQIAQLEAYCKAQELELAVIFREKGVSGYTPLANRPGGAELLGMIKRGEVQHVVTLKLDRIFRNVLDCISNVLAWEKAGIGFHMLDLGGQSINTKSAMGRFMLQTYAGLAELERSLTAERTKAVSDHLRKNKKPYCPDVFGFDRRGAELVENEKEQAVIERIQLQHAQGVALAEIARRLNSEGVPTKRGKSWHASTVYYLVNRERCIAA